jgi:hypothetical protein
MLHTLGLLKGTLVDTVLQRLVEERVEHLLGDIDCVVGADILLERLTAGECVSEMTSELRPITLCGGCDRVGRNVMMFGCDALNVESSYLEPLRSLSCKWEQRVSKNDSRHA